MKMKRCSTLLVLFLLAAAKIMGQTEEGRPGPKLPPTSVWRQAGCLFWQAPQMPSDAVIAVMLESKMVLLDIELASANLPKRLKEGNRELIVGIYTNPMEVFTTSLSGRPWQNRLIDTLNRTFDDPGARKSFFIYNPEHAAKIRYTEGSYPMYLLNLTGYCPQINGTNYAGWIARRIVDQCKPNAKNIDLIFIDNALRDFAWIGSYKPLDVNWNGINDYEEISGQADVFQHPINSSFRGGVSNICKIIRKELPGVSIIGNQGNEFYADCMTGKFFENIDKGNTPGPSLYNYGALMNQPAEVLYCAEKFLAPAGLTKNVFHFSTSRINNEETAMAMALLYPGSFACFGYGYVPLSDNMKLDIGVPVGGRTVQNDFLIQSFERATVVFNPSNTSKEFHGVIIEPSRGKIIPDLYKN